MKISARQCGFVDLTESQEISAFVEQISTTDTDIEINLHGCLIGYETSQLINDVAIKFSNREIQKSIFFNIEYPFLSEATLWEWFFKDSPLWSEHGFTTSQDNMVNTILNAVLDKYNIVLRIGTNED